MGCEIPIAVDGGANTTQLDSGDLTTGTVRRLQLSIVTLPGAAGYAPA